MRTRKIFKKIGWRFGRSTRRWRRELESFEEKLFASRTGVERDEIVRAQVLKLQLVKDAELRIRTIQSLLDINYKNALAPALYELMLLSSEWPEESAGEGVLFLMKLVAPHCPEV
jgi:hypothetical protein